MMARPLRPPPPHRDRHLSRRQNHARLGPGIARRKRGSAMFIYLVHRRLTTANADQLAVYGAVLRTLSKIFRAVRGNIPNCQV